MEARRELQSVASDPLPDDLICSPVYRIAADENLQLVTE